MEQVQINGSSQVFPPIPAGPAARNFGGPLPPIPPAISVTSSEGASDILSISGVLTADTVLTIPTPTQPQIVGTNPLSPLYPGTGVLPSWIKLIQNLTTGAFKLTLSGPSGLGNKVAMANATPTTVTGTADITAPALYGPAGTLAGGGVGLTVILTIDGVLQPVFTFDGTGLGNDANEAAMLAALGVAFPGIVATQGGPSTKELVLTDKTLGPAGTIVIGAGTANVALGLVAPTTVPGLITGPHTQLMFSPNGDDIFAGGAPA